MAARTRREERSVFGVQSVHVILLSLALLAGGQEDAPPSPEPPPVSKVLQPMVEVVLEMFEHADVIALGEDHGSRLDSEFRMALVRHPDFARTVNRIVIEFANGRHQDVLDRYVRGEEVARPELVRIWRDTGFLAWESPIYEAFLSTVRAVNADLPTERKIRVFAGDRPIPWDEMTSGRELMRYSDRGDYPIHIVDCEILDKGHKGLLIYGSFHLLHGEGQSFVTSLDKKYPGRIKTLIGMPSRNDLHGRLRSTMQLGDSPKLISPQGTVVASWNFYESIGFDKSRSSLTMSEAVDGLLYYGDLTDDIVRADPTIFADPAFRELRALQSRLRAEFSEIVAREGWGGMHQYDEYECE